AHDIAVEERHRTAAHLHQLDHQCIGDRRLARTGEAGEEDGETLPGARGLAAAEFGDNLGEGEPLWDLQSLPQAAPEFGAGDVEDGLAFLYLVTREILSLFLHVDHLLEVDHLDAD